MDGTPHSPGSSGSKDTQALLENNNIPGRRLPPLKKLRMPGSVEDEEWSPKTPSTPAEKVRFLLSRDEDDESDYEVDENLISDRSIFCQLDQLCHFDDGEAGWKEMARWLKYEEKVDSANRWSKPHVSTTSLHSLFEVQRMLKGDRSACVFDLDLESGLQQHVAGITPKVLLPPEPQRDGDPAWTNLVKLIEHIAGAVQQQLNLTPEKTGQLVQLLLKPHKHKHRRAAKEGFSKKKIGMKNDLARIDKQQEQFPDDAKPDNLKAYKPNKRFLKKIPKGSEVANIMVGEVDFFEETVAIFVRLAKATKLADVTEVELPTKFVFLILGPQNFSELGEQGRAVGSLFADKVFGEVAYKANSSQDLLDGIEEYMDDLTVLPPSVWDPTIRLEPPQTAISMDKIRSRLDPDARARMNKIELHEEMDDPSLVRTGKLFGGLIGDIKRRYPYYLSDFKDAIHMQTIASIFFMFFACITPIVTFGGLMGDKTDQYMGVMECILSGAICGFLYAVFAGQPLTIVGATGPLLIFESIVYSMCKSNGWDFMVFRFWIGMWVCLILFLMVMFDLSALVRYITRFTEESFSVLISVIFTYEAFHKVFHIWHTHPLETGVIHKDDEYRCFCVPSNDSATIVPSTVKSIEVNATANSSYSIMGAVTEPPPVYNLWNWTNVLPEDCITLTGKVTIGVGCLTEEKCEHYGWEPEGPACHDHQVIGNVPNVFLLSCFLFIGTFGLAYFFRCFRTMRFFPSIVRQTLADFAVLISIIVFTSADIGFGINTPKLTVPSKFEPTNSEVRGWVINPLGMKPEHWWLALLAIVPAILATILIFLDQQITAVIVNRREHKLKKPHGYHLDLFVLMFLIGISSLLGLPWFVAATVRALTHVRSLFKESEVKIPGEKPYHLGVREQRVTGIVIHVFIACSIFITNILQYIPMPVLYGVFLYMGITSLGGVQFVDRIGLLFMPAKYQPDYIYLRHVKTTKVHLFTIIQLVCFAIMWVIKQNKSTAIGFPLMLLVLCIVRKLMDYFFTQSELYWLDHLFPEAMRRMKEDEAKRHDNGAVYGDEEMVKIKGYEADSPANAGLLDEEKYLPMDGEDHHMRPTRQ